MAQVCGGTGQRYPEMRGVSPEGPEIQARRSQGMPRLRAATCSPHSGSISWLSIAIVALLFIGSALADANLRGISPEDQKFYSSSIIWCKDGSRSFPRERLNDDFCDCVDGTDEPGTSACPDGQFYCENKGHVSTYIFSSRVNDGICDCCDGSDEYQGKVKCANTCWEAGKLSREKLQKKINTLKEGLIIKSKDIELAKQLRSEHQTKLSKLKREEIILSDAVGKLKVEKEAVEKAEKQEQLEKEKQEKEEREKKERENPTSHSQDSLDKAGGEEDDDDDFVSTSNDQNNPSSTTHDAANHLDHTEAPVSPGAETKLVVDELVESLDLGDEVAFEKLSKDELGKLIASRWTGEHASLKEKMERHGDKGEKYEVDAKLSEVEELASDKAGETGDLEKLSKEELGKVIASRWTGEYTGEKGTTKEGVEDGAENREADTDHHHDYEHDYDEDYEQVDDNIADEDIVDEDKEPGKDTYGYENSQDDAAFSSLPPTTPSLWSRIRDKAQALLRSVRNTKIPFNKSDAERIRNEFHEVSSKLSDVRSQISDLESKLKQDLGKEGEFCTMYEKCFERKQNKYTYKVCPFKDATQLEGHSSTRLGSWHGFQDGYTSMMFQSGDRCWNGPDRSFRIRLRCGPKSELLTVDEPSRCEYVADFSTPAACQEEKLQALQSELHVQTAAPETHEEL